MSSLFNKKPAEQRPTDPYARDHVAKEIEHLQKRTSTRHRDGKEGKIRGGWIVMLILLVIGVLYCLDPIAHAWHRGTAIRTYLYLHRYGADKKAQQLLDTGIIAPSEAESLDRRTGSYQDYYPNAAAANQDADSIIQYMHEVYALQAGSYEKLDALGKIRYNLFVRFGLRPPTNWTWLDPSVY